MCVCISHKHDTQTTHLTYIYPLAHPQCFRMLVHVKVDEKSSTEGCHQWGEEQVSPARQRERTRAACLGWVLAPPELHSPGRTGDIWPLCLCSGRLFLQGWQLLLNLWALSQYGKMWFFPPSLYFLKISQGLCVDEESSRLEVLKAFPSFSLKRQLKKSQRREGSAWVIQAPWPGSKKPVISAAGGECWRWWSPKKNTFTYLSQRTE